MIHRMLVPPHRNIISLSFATLERLSEDALDMPTFTNGKVLVNHRSRMGRTPDMIKDGERF